MSLTAVWDSSPYDAEERAKIRGQRRASSARHRDLALARQVAQELAQGGGEVTGDDVRRVLAERHPEALEGCLNYLGSVWERDKWAPVGFVRSRTPGSHGNRLVQWRLK